MDKIDIPELHRIWEVEMGILDVIDKVCRENGLKYSLAYGSMIGAVRHGGFIPWDDDMDIWMLRKDYDKFIEIWENNTVDGYFLLRQETSPEYPQNFTKIRKCNTAFVSAGEENTNYHHGIFVDVFPMDDVANDNFKAKLQGYCALFYMLYCRGYASTRDGKLMYWGGRLLLDVMPNTLKKKLKSFFFKRMTKYNGADSKRVACFVTAPDSFIYYDKELFYEYDDVKFDTHVYMCNKDSDTLLRSYYGDYMKLPPIEERVLKHHPVIVDFEKEYWAK